MPTASEYRCEAKSCLELANRTNELYVKDALTELALEYLRTARRVERRDRDHNALAVPNFQAPSR
jgi:hypothetical protein